MAERTVTVRLRANISEYTNALRKAQGDTSAFGRIAAKDFSKLGSDIEQVGRSMTTRVTLPVVAGGAAALKMGSDFETAFAQMVGLAGVTADEVDGLRESVLRLSGETAVAPQDLADALYFASSAGLDTADALEAVEVAAKASAAGMGATSDIVGLVASAMASYGSGALDAAKATDILTAAVRAGRADPRELAGSLGVVLPIASQLGVTFGEVGGTVAYLSNVFGDTSRTTNSLRAMFANLLSPTAEGRKTLEQYTGSVDSLKNAIDENGLLGALEVLRTSGIAKNDVAMRSLFSDVDGYTAAISLLSDANGDLASTLGEVSNSAGSLDSAFDAASNTKAFEMKQAWAELQVTLIKVGELAAPLVADFAQLAAAALEFFGMLPDWAQKGTVGFLVLSAAVGPLLSKFELLKSGAEIGVRAFQRFQVQLALAKMEGITTGEVLGQMAARMAIYTAAVVGATFAINKFNEENSKHENNQDAIRQSIIATGDAMKGSKAWFDQYIADHEELAARLASIGVSSQEFVSAMMAGGDAAEDMAKKVGGTNAAAFSWSLIGKDMRTAAEQAADAQTAVGDAATDAAAGIDEAAIKAQLAALGLGDMGNAADMTAAQIQALGDALEASFSKMFGLDQVALGVDNAFADFNDTMSDTDVTATRTGRSIDAAAERTKAIEQATRRAEDAQRSYEKSLRDQEKAVEDVADAEKALEEARKGPSSRDKADADRDRRAAMLALQRAQQGVTKAQEELTKATEKGDPEEIRDKNLALKEALLERERAQVSLGDATDKLSDLQSWNAETSDDVADAQDRLTEAKDRAEEATRNVTDRMRDLNEAQAEARDTAAKSVADFDNAAGGVSRVRDRALEGRNAFDRLSEGIKEAITNLIALDATAAEKASQLYAIEDAIKANAFLTEEQRSKLLELVRANRNRVIKLPDSRVVAMAEGGIIKPSPGGTMLRAAEVGVPEAFVPLTPAGISAFMPALAGISASGGSSQPIVVQLVAEGRVLTQLVVDESKRVGGLPIRVRQA